MLSYTDTHIHRWVVHRYTGTQISSTQIHRYTKTQVHRSALHRYIDTQKHRYTDQLYTDELCTAEGASTLCSAGRNFSLSVQNNLGDWCLLNWDIVTYSWIFLFPYSNSAVTVIMDSHEGGVYGLCLFVLTTTNYQADIRRTWSWE